MGYPTSLRLCGVGGVLGGVLFIAWGYIDRPNISEGLRAVTEVLGLVVHVLFLMALTGVVVLCRSRLGVLGWTGIMLAVYGLGWGVVAGIVGATSVWVYFAERGWPHYLYHGWAFLFTGLLLIGIATVRGRPLRGLGALVFAIGVFSWVYYLTDSGAVLEARLIHVGFGLLFSIGWAVLGLWLWVGGTRQSKETYA